MKPFSEQIKVEGLFEYTCRMMREKRYSLPQAGGTWYPPVRKPASSVAQPPESLGKPVAVIPPKPLVVTSIDNVDEQDAELEAYLEPNPQELEVSVPLAHEDAELVMDEISGESEELSGVVDGD